MRLVEHVAVETGERVIAHLAAQNPGA